jgi:hypothetical protein
MNGDRDLVLRDVLDSLDQVWGLIAARRLGLTQDEFLWEPVAGSWTVHRTADGVVVDGSGVDGSGVDGDGVDEERDEHPGRVTTIAWREWHIAIDCLESYSERLFGGAGTGLRGGQWVDDVHAAGELLSTAWTRFRDGIAAAGSSWLFEPLGDEWGPYATSTRLALALHAQHEVAHHGAEIALLRDLYASRTTTH